MRRYTDAYFTITAENAHFTTGTDIHVTFGQAYRKLDIFGDNIEVLDDERLKVFLSQEQTSKLSEDDAEMQINYINAEGLREASDCAVVEVNKNLLERIL